MSQFNNLSTMKSRLSFVVLLIFLIGLTPYVTVSAQTYTVSPTGWTGKPSTNVTYNGNTWMAGTTDGVYVKAKAVVSGTSLTFNVQKSSGTFNSQTSVTIRKDMKISGSSVTDAGTIIKMSSMSAGNSGMTIDIEPDFSSGSHTYHFILTSGSTVFYTNPITVSAESSSLCPDNNHPHMIDLGLPSGTKWACCNVGAQSPEETGCYYAWGETTGSCEGKTIFDWEYYKYNHYDINDENSKYGNCLTKYCQDSEYGYNGFTDELTTLESTDDAATVNWGDQWRMPNRTEMNELINKNNTSWTVTTLNGVAGLLVTSLVEGYTDKSIFLPFTGWFDWKTVDDFGVYAEYWTSSVYHNPYSQAYRMYIDNSGKKGSGTRERDTGLTIRPIYIGSVALDPLSLSLNSIVVTKGESTSVQITSGNGSYTVATNNSDVATATIDGSSVTVTAITAGTATITVTDTQSGETATIEVTVTEPISLCPDNNHPHMIDLGLPSGTKWACCNVDATTPEGYGGYYAWGETETKTSYDWSNYIHCDGSEETCYDLGSDIAGTQYDVAHVKWGGSWVMPSFDQFKELRDNCTYEWMTANNVNVGKFTSKINGASIFLPASGFRVASFFFDGDNGNCWSSTQDPLNARDAIYLEFNSGESGTDSNYGRYYGRNVRPVFVEFSVTPLQLSENSIDMTTGEETTINITSGNGSYTVATNNSDVANAVIDGSSVTVTAITAGTATITVTDTQSGETATIEVTVTEPISLCPDNNHPHMIDLGLPSGTMWSCCNVDTSHPENQKPSNNGGYYAWGETEEKDNYTWATYIHCDGSEGTCHNLGESIVGTQYDVAHVRWGDQWQMATVVQNQELVNNCTYSWTTIDGVSGGLFTGSNGASIFFPAAGYRTQNGYNNLGINAWCWTGIAYSENNYDSRTFVLSSSNQSTTGRGSRYYGRSVRPVSTVSAFAPLRLSESSVEIMKGENTTIEITSGNGNYTVKSSNSSVAKATVTDSSVTVSAVGGGTATITVTDTKSGYQETVEVTVIVHLQLSKSSADITRGENATINITGNGSYSVSSNDSNVATATIDGSSVTITAVSVGTATLTVTDTKTGETVDIAVTVHTPLAISENSLSMMVGDADVVVQLTGGSGTCSVTSSNTNVVRGTFQALEGGGNITVHAVGKGTATLTVKDTKTGSQVTIEVTAKDHLQLAKSSVDITVGGNTTVNISKGNDSYAVSSSNQNVATATIDGSSVNITALGVGIATITVTDTETGETATIDITVYTPLVLSKSTWSMIADYDDDEVVRLTGGSGTYTVTSSNQNVVTATIEALDNSGTITVHAVGAGTATITLKDAKTGDQMTMEVTVFAPLILAKKALHLYPNYNKESVYISSGNGGYTAVSSNSSVATAAIDGSSVKITALKKGTATITVTDTQTALTATVEVTVIDHSNDPLTPASPFPSDGAVDVGTSGTFVWLIPTFNGGKGTPYELYLDTDESFSNTNGRPYRTGTGNSCAFTGLKPGTKYYWKVKMDNGRGQSVISEVWNFTTKNQNMYVPIMRGDVNGDKNVTISDVMMIVNHVVTNTTGSNFIAAHADVNGDGNINITDAMMLVRIILNEDTTEPCLEVWHKDGSKIMFSLDEYPKVTYLGDMVTIEAATTVEYEFQAIRKMTFNQSAKTISTTVTPFTRNGETVTFLPADADLSVRVTLPNGRTLREFVVRKGERATLPLDARIADVYRINVNGVTYKIKTR